MLIRRTGESAWRSPEVTAYQNERAIQMLIERSPDLLPGSEGLGMVVATELGLEAGRVDLVGVDTDGTVTIVECKLKANPEIRRRVVGQIFAYAATLWGLSYAEFDEAFARATGGGLAARVTEIAGEGWNEESFRARVEANLRDGRFRLIIAVDEITAELEKIVRFLNGHSDPALQVLALQLGYVADGDVEILLPTVYGVESARSKVEAERRTWTTDAIFAALGERCSATVMVAVDQLREFVAARTGEFAPSHRTKPWLNARLPIGGEPVNVFTFEETAGRLSLVLPLSRLVDAGVPTEPMAVLVEQLSQIPAVTRIPGVARRFRVQDIRRAGFKKYPGMALDDLLAQPDGMDALAGIEAALDGFLRSADVLSRTDPDA